MTTANLEMQRHLGRGTEAAVPRLDGGKSGNAEVPRLKYLGLTAANLEL